jgi:serine/threonine protein kinase
VPVTIFGRADKVVDGLTEAWCIAKIARLVGPMEPPVKTEYDCDFEVADFLESETFVHPATSEPTKYISVGTLREELERLPRALFPLDFSDFLEYLLVIDHIKRPTAREALENPFLKTSLT